MIGANRQPPYAHLRTKGARLTEGAPLAPLSLRTAFRRRHSRGFTLLELVMVLMLLAIIVAAAAPSLRGWNRGQRLDNSAEQFISAARWARTQAISTAAPHAIEINGAAGSYRVVRLDAEGNAPAAGEFGGDMILPPNFLIDVIRQDESGTSVIEFYPNGRLTPATVVITADWGETATIASTASAESFRRIRTEGGF